MSSKPGIVKEGWLKRVKNQKKRYFVLCFNKDSGAAQLTYYENEKKFTSKSEPKRIIFLQDCLGIISKEDAKHGHILVLYTKDDVFAVTAETEELLNSWLNDLDKLHKMENTNKNLVESKYDLVWNVKVMERGLAFIKKMAGSYKLCLKDDSLFFVDPTTQEVKIEEKLHHIRRYGHMDYCFFMEFGRSTTLGAGEIWMEVEDPLIAQKIHETLSRSAKPASGETTTVQKKTKSNRHSMVAYSNERYRGEPKNVTNNVTNNNNNNTPSPKTRRLTLNVFSKKKEVSRPHSKSVSLSANVKEEGRESAERVLQFPPRTTPTKDDEDSEEENKHYPRITPPVPSISRRKSKSSTSGSMDGNTSSKNKGAETKSLTEESEMRCEENVYTEVKAKRRSVSKQNCSDVRRGYAAEKRRSATFPRNRSVSDADRRRIDSEKSSDGERYGDSDKDGARESDKEDDGNAFLPQEGHYLNMKPRQRIMSDSSSEGPSPYLPVRPPNSSVDHYIKMNSPRVTPDLESTRLSTSSARSDAIEEMDPGCSSYVNMSPGQGMSSRIGSSSNESQDDTQAGDSGEETFDHLHHDDTDDDGLSQSMNYVNMGLGYNSSPLKKSLSHTYHSPHSDYVNVNMSRSKSMGSKSPRSRVFEIVQEPSSSGEEEAGTQSPRSYVNIKAKDDEGMSSDSVGTHMSYENFMLGKNGGRKETNMNYISVDFSEKTSNGIVKGHPTGRSSPSNYSKIDFNKSRGLADVSSTRERELHGTQ